MEIYINGAKIICSFVTFPLKENYVNNRNNNKNVVNVTVMCLKCLKGFILLIFTIALKAKSGITILLVRDDFGLFKDMYPLSR